MQGPIRVSYFLRVVISISVLRLAGPSDVRFRLFVSGLPSINATPRGMY